MNRKTLTLIIALVCAVVFVLGCTGTSGKNPSTAAPTEQAQLPTELRITVIWMFGKV